MLFASDGLRRVNAMDRERDSGISVVHDGCAMGRAPRDQPDVSQECNSSGLGARVNFNSIRVLQSTGSEYGLALPTHVKISCPSFAICKVGILREMHQEMVNCAVYGIG